MGAAHVGVGAAVAAPIVDADLGDEGVSRGILGKGWIE